MKIKGKGTFVKWLTTEIANRNKQGFYKLINDDFAVALKRIDNNKAVDLNIVSFSSENDFPEQVLSILSFLKYIGIPKQWTLYSDGTHTEKHQQLLQANLPFVTIVFTDLSAENEPYFVLKDSLLPYKKELLDYARKKPLGKKLLFYLNHQIENSVLFLDSDILFYSKARNLPYIFHSSLVGWFLPDCTGGGNLSKVYLDQHPFQMHQVNSGIILMNQELKHHADGLNLLKQAEDDYDYFTEQTILHIIIKANHFFPLDPRLYLVDTSDQFRYSYANNTIAIAARHFTGPVRHKMWQRGWKWQLQLNH